MKTSFSHLFFTAAMFSLCTLMVLPAQADTSSTKTEKAKRPKVCLVLSGGGARGAAHIGVIKVLEEYRVPIDCIAGTSMGSLIGAAYASGTSVSDMEKLVGGLSINSLFQDIPPREELHIRHKKEDHTQLVGPEIGMSSLGGSNLPKGIISGVQLETVLRKLSAPGYRDFDKLSIPYRAVATNLVTGKAEVFEKGDLASVMRASMSVPVAIAPVEIDGKILVDGMLTDNLPIDVAYDMGADIVIAVNVGTPLMKREELGSIIGVAGQMINILTEQNVQNSLALLKTSDILISPELGDFSTSDFDHLPDTLPIGEAAARKVSDQLSKLSLSPEQYAWYRKGIASATAQDTRPVDKIQFDHLKRVNPEYLLSLMETKPKEVIQQETLNGDLRKLYGTKDFEHVGYRIHENNGERVMTVEALEKSWGPDYFRFGLGLSTDFQENADFNLLARFRQTWLNSLGAESITDIQLGEINRFASEFYQPVTAKQDYFIAPMIELKQDTTKLYNEEQNIARYSMERYQAGIDMGLVLGTYGEMRMGIRRGILNPSLDIGPSYLAPNEEHVDQGGFMATLLLDKLDSVTFPTDGWFLKGSLYNATSSLGSDDSYAKWNTQANYIHSFDGHTFNLFALAEGSMNGELPYYDQHQWGGFLRQSGYQTGQLLGDSLLYSRIMYYNKLLEYQALDGLYVGFSLEAGKMEDPLISTNSTDLMLSGAAFVATDTPLGPLYFSYGHAVDGSGSFYLFLGLPY